MNKKFTSMNSIFENNKLLENKKFSRNLIEDTILQLNKVKIPMQEIMSKAHENPYDIEIKKKKANIIRKKNGFLRSLIKEVKESDKYNYEIKWTNHLRKLTLVFSSKEKGVIHISHTPPVGIRFISPNKETAKELASHIGDNKLRTLSYETIKNRMI